MEDINIKNAHHYQQNDAAVINSFEIEFPIFIKKLSQKGLKNKYFPNTNNHKILQMQTWLWVSYLNRVGFCYNYDENKMENLIGEMKDQYIQYFNKVEYF